MVLSSLLVACEEAERIVDRYRDLTPHEAYLESLEDAGLAETALGRSWARAAERALRDPVAVDLPFREEGWFPPADPSAVGYRLTLRRGQVLTVRAGIEAAEPSSDPAVRLFVQLFRLAAGPEDPPRPVQDLDSLPGEDGAFAYEPWRDGEYVLRIQPELLGGGRYRASLSLDAALAFPVEDRDHRAIQSFFGAERDGGARDHHGVDIFAPRGTPVLAAADGRVSRANETPRGGRVVWLRDERRSQSLYYAHLDSQAVSRGQQVRRGDTLGFVGNTGNARTTPPHLHFGIYRRGEGPVDPLVFVRRPAGLMPDWPGDATRVGRWVRVASAGARLRDGPSTDRPVLTELPLSTALRVMGGTGDWWRVRLPDGSGGWISDRVVESLSGPIALRVAAAGEEVRSRPWEDAGVIGTLPGADSLAVMARFGEWELVEQEEGLQGWLLRGL